MNKKRLLYISRLNTENKKHLGTLKKVRGMCMGFLEEYDVFLEFETGKNYHIETIPNQCCIDQGKINGFWGRLLFYKYIYQWIIQNKIDILYIRFDHLDTIMLLFFKKLHKANVKIILELPTYPYSGERDQRHNELLKKRRYVEYTIKRIVAKVEERNTKFVSRYINKIITYTYDGIIWNTPTLCIENGVDCDCVKIRESSHASDEIILCCVANLSPWHAIDRVVEGLKNYYNSCDRRNKVFLWLVGEGQETQNIRLMTTKYKLEDHILFLGPKTGSDLENIMEQVDLGVGTLGLYRIGLPWGSTLKSKEYCAAGLPFIYSSREKALKGDEPFALKFEDNDSPIDMQLVIDFANKVRNDMSLRKLMRKKAEEEYSWKALTKKIMENID